STGQPSALADLAKAAGMILPMFMGGGGRRGHFRGGRFTHGFGGFGHLHGGQHPAGRGAWPYHHPQMGWHMHGRPPGFGWRPLHPNDAQALVGGGMGGGQQGQGQQPGQQDPNAPDPNNPPPEKNGQPIGGGETMPVGKGPWADNPVLSTLVGAESGGRQGPNVRGDDGLATGYYQIQTPTWKDFAPRVPGAAQYGMAEQAPPDVQQAVASIIPVARFGDRTRAILHSKFGAFNEKMTVGELADRYAPANSVVAAGAIPTTLPLTSRPMVASQ
ncbi:MAG TPA: hypothetical protein VIH81_10735, partial [Roseiarcus sp.]